MKSLTLICLALVVAGCTDTSRLAYAPPESATLITSTDDQKGSLFAGDAAVVSDTDIDRILKFQYHAPRQIRIAVLPFARETWFGYSDELARTGNEVRSQLLSELRSNPRITQAAFLPTLLIPSKSTVPYFREAAARYQADLLLIYQAACRTYDKNRLFAASQGKSYCNVEALLLDTRTGIVPFTTNASEEFTTTQSRADANLYETMRKAELNAIRSALLKVGGQTSDFLQSTAD
jgi:hypothetical protein